MKNNINLVKGTHDIYGAEMEKFEFIIESFYSVCKKFNFKSIQTPIIEQQELFSRAVERFVRTILTSLVAMWFR